MLSRLLSSSNRIDDEDDASDADDALDAPLLPENDEDDADAAARREALRSCCERGLVIVRGLAASLHVGTPCFASLVPLGICARLIFDLAEDEAPTRAMTAGEPRRDATAAGQHPDADETKRWSAYAARDPLGHR